LPNLRAKFATALTIDKKINILAAMSIFADSVQKCLVPENPLLSICIPTYNRSAFLATLLENLTHNISLNTSGVEIVIADNASTDETPSICRSFLGRLPLRIIRRPETIIGPRNYIQLIHAEAVGKFCLILGDDDMIMLGGLDYLLAALTTYSDSFFLITNFGNAPHSEIQNAVINSESRFIGDFKPAGMGIPDVRRFESFQDAIAIEGFDFGRYWSFLSVIFRRDVCAEEASRLDKYLSTATITGYRPEIWFTHYVMWLRTLKAGYGYYLPGFVILQGVGSQCWADEKNLIGMWTQVYPLLYLEWLNSGPISRRQQIRARREIVGYYWNGVFIALQKKIWPFDCKGGWLSHSAQYLSILARHPIPFFSFLARLFTGIFRRFVKHPWQRKAAPINKRSL
jgi:glycosyltransferase involved in cell wall biosynthesis